MALSCCNSRPARATAEDEDEDEYDWGTSERLRGRRNERSEHQIFLEISSLYLVFALQS